MKTTLAKDIEPEWVVAIPAQNWVARFHWPAKGGTHRQVHLPVVAWSDCGAALVADKATGRLKRVTDDPTFVKLLQVGPLYEVPTLRPRKKAPDADEDEKGLSPIETPDGEDGAE